MPFNSIKSSFGGFRTKIKHPLPHMMIGFADNGGIRVRFQNYQALKKKKIKRTISSPGGKVKRLIRTSIQHRVGTDRVESEWL